MISIIVAVNNVNTIGLNGSMPWRNAEDLRHFRDTTMHKTVVMGRKTIEGLPKILDGRHVVMVSRFESGQDVINDFDEFLKKHEKTDEEVFIAGGGEIYRKSISYASKLYVSRINDDTHGDTTFPEIDPRLFDLIETIPYETFNLEIYERK